MTSALAGAGCLFLLAAPSGCAGHCSDHAVGEYSCDGNTLVGCRMDDSGDLSVEQNCGDRFCRNPTPGQALCALRHDPEPACTGSGSWVCDAAGQVVVCGPGGYLFSLLELCGAPELCITQASATPFCALATEPDPRCPQPPAPGAPFICGDGHLLFCQSGYVVKDTNCGGPDLCYAPGPAPTASSPGVEARCIVSASIDPRCQALPQPPFGDGRSKSVCDGTQIDYCLDNLLTGTHECGAKGCQTLTGVASCNQ